MSIVLVQANGLLAADKGGTSDPYAVLKTGGMKKKSKTIKKTLDPQWHQEFIFEGEKAKMKELSLAMWDWDRIGSDDALGNAIIPFDDIFATPETLIEKEVELSTQGTVLLRFTWSPKVQIKGPLGDATILGEDDPNAVDGTVYYTDLDAKGTLRVTLISAENLVAADKTGTSDPYAVFLVDTEKKKSKVIYKTLNPKWNNEGFEWHGDKTNMKTLDLVMWDRDPGLNKDDRLGSAHLDLEEKGVFEDGKPEQEFVLPLSTKGSVRLRVDWRTVAEDTMPETLEAIHQCSEEKYVQEWKDEQDVEPFAWDRYVARLPWNALRAGYAECTLRLTVKAGYGLLAADVTGTSDPYVTIKLAGNEFKTKTIPKTLFPRWEETFEVKQTACHLTSKAVRVEVFDDDKHSKDDSIGTTSLSKSALQTVIEKARHRDGNHLDNPDEAEGAEFWLKLGTQGYIGLRLTVELDEAPTWCDMLVKLLEPLRGPINTLLTLHHWLPAMIKRNYSDATLVVTLVSGAKLPAADIGGNVLRGGLKGTSDPYVVLQFNGRTMTSTTIPKTVNPVWNEAFEFRGFVKDLCGGPIELEVFDKDLTTADDSIGFSDVQTGKLWSLFRDAENNDLPPDSDGTEVVVPLTTKGTLTLNLSVQSRSAPTWSEVWTRAVWQPLQEARKKLPSFEQARQLRENFKATTITITVNSAKGLKAADRDIFGKLSSSDPYVNFELAGDVVQSSTKYKTLDPVWEETLTPITKTLVELESDTDGCLNVEVFDDDVLDADDPIGLGKVSIKEYIIERAGNPDPVEITVVLQDPNNPKLQVGELVFTIHVLPFEPPSWAHVLYEINLPWMREFRAFFLYYRLPYDLTIWSKLYDPWYYILTYIAASPNVLIRGGFFTIYLGCVLSAGIEEFIVMRFILGLKGSQFISGIIKTIVLCFKFWRCTVTSGDPMGCEVMGPGVGHHSVFNYILILAWLQALLWVAFLILPYSGQLNPSTGRISYQRSTALYKEAREWANKRREARHAKLERRKARSAGEPIVTSAPTPAVSTPGSEVEAANSNRRGSGVLRRGSGVQVGSIGAAIPPSLQFRSQQSGYFKLPDVESGPASLPAPDVANGSKTTFTRINDIKEWMNTSMERLTLEWDTLSYPMRAGVAQNRLFSLLTWDTNMSIACLGLFFVLMLDAEWTKESLLAAQEGRDLDRHPLWHVSLMLYDMTGIFYGDFWTSWRTQITFQLMKVLFSLSAFPFFFFTIGPLAKLFAHADPTAYTRSGRLATPDAAGLSAYLRWLKNDVLGTKKYREELELNFPEREIKRLYRQVTEADQVLENAWKKPSSAVRLQRKAKLDLDKLLASIVTKEKASRKLFIKCFPDQFLVDAYIDKLAAHKEAERAKEERSKQHAKELKKAASKKRLE